MKAEVMNDISVLIDELNKTDNSTLQYFCEVRDELRATTDMARERELLEILSRSSRIMDAGGFNLAQRSAWERMFESIMKVL